MFMHVIQIITSVIGWYALSYYVFSIDFVLAALLASGGVLQIIHQIKEFHAVFFLTPNMAALASLISEHKENISKWNIDRLKATQTTNDSWDITNFEPIGNMYINAVEIELILGLLHKNGEIDDNYNISDYRLQKQGNVIYVLVADDDKPLFRLEADAANS